PRVVSSLRGARGSWNVVSMFRRPVYAPLKAVAGRPRSVLKKYSSRCVPSRSWTNTQRTGTRPRPLLYQGPVPPTTPTRRVPPPYQPTVSRHRLLGLGQPAALDPRPALAGVRRGRLVQVGGGVEL